MGRRAGWREQRYGLFGNAPCGGLLNRFGNPHLLRASSVGQLHQPVLHQRVYGHTVGERGQRLFEHCLRNFAGRLRLFVLIRRPNPHLQQREHERVIYNYLVQCRLMCRLHVNARR